MRTVIALLALLVAWQTGLGGRLDAAVALDTVRAGVSIAQFTPKLPKIIQRCVEIEELQKGLWPLLDGLSNALDTTKLAGVQQAVTAFAEKKYTELNLTRAAEQLSAAIPETISSLLALYPLIRTYLEQVVYPAAVLTSDLCGLIHFRLAQTIADDIRRIVERQTVAQIFTMLNELDELLSSGLMPRIVSLLEEIDIALPLALQFKILEPA
ncbi:MAG: hypothetical protein M1549_00920 [Candidatus Dependentiae bacterium]|jgi:hypothetical protein|nr:hypothetical protein [Candidatus Dependentiae bacterium]